LRIGHCSVVGKLTSEVAHWF